MKNETLPERQWLTSQELVAMYGVEASYNAASRVAKRLVKDYGIPWYREGYKWRRMEQA